MPDRPRTRTQQATCSSCSAPSRCWASSPFARRPAASPSLGATMTDTNLNLYVDVMCAHSYLAYPGLRAALSDRRAAGHRVTLRIHPLLIAPNAPINASEPLPDVHRRLFGPSSRSNEQAMTQRATAAGIPLHYERAQFTSTIPALAAILQAQDR